MSVSCGSLPAAPSTLLVTAHSLPDGPCHTYYIILAEYRWGKSRAQHHLSHCLVNRSASHTQLVPTTLSYALGLAPKDDLLTPSVVIVRGRI